MFLIAADAATHPDEAARDRMLKAVRRLREIAQGDISPTLLARLPVVAAILDEKMAPISAAV